MQQFAARYTDENGAQHTSTPVPEDKARYWARLMRDNGHPDAVVVCRDDRGYWRQVWPKP